MSTARGEEKTETTRSVFGSPLSLPAVSIRTRSPCTESVGYWGALALRAEVRRSPRQANARDRRLAARARFTRAAVDAELVLILTLQSRAADVVANAGAAALDRSLQHRPDRL